MSKMFEKLDEALSEALEFVRGNVKVRTKEIFIPDSPKNYRAEEIKKLRSKLGITQNDLASWLNVSLNTVQAWEQNTRNPSHSSLRLLEIFDKDFSVIERILKGKKTMKTKRSVGSYGSSGLSSKGNIAARSRN
ncbi:MAG TPA: helix-turn-helix domain-containing protein [Waddliaceae bacterium]